MILIYNYSKVFSNINFFPVLLTLQVRPVFNDTMSNKRVELNP